MKKLLLLFLLASPLMGQASFTFPGDITVNNGGSVTVEQIASTPSFHAKAGSGQAAKFKWSLNPGGASFCLSFSTFSTDPFVDFDCDGVMDGAGAGEYLLSTPLSALDLSCTNCIGPTEISTLTLGTDVTGPYVASIADGTGIDGTASGAGSTYTPTLDLTEINSATFGNGSFTSITFNGPQTNDGNITENNIDQYTSYRRGDSGIKVFDAGSGTSEEIDLVLGDSAYVYVQSTGVLLDAAPLILANQNKLAFRSSSANTLEFRAPATVSATQTCTLRDNAKMIPSSCVEENFAYCKSDGTNCPVGGAGAGFTFLGGTGTSSLSTSATQYFPLVGNNPASATEADVYFAVPALTPSKFYCRVTGGNLTTGSFTFAIRNAGTSTNLDWSCTVSSGGATCSDTVGSAIADETLIDIQVVPASTPDANRRAKCYFTGK